MKLCNVGERKIDSMNKDGAARFSCPDWVELSEAFDSGEEIPAALQKHLEECPECARAWQTMVKTRAYLCACAEDAMRVYDPEAMKQNIYRKLARPRVIRFDRLQKVGSLAAMFLAGMFTFYLFFTGDSSEKALPQFIHEPASQQTIAAGNSAEPVVDRETFLRNLVAAYPYYSVNENEQGYDPKNSYPLPLANLVNVDLRKSTSPTFQAVRNEVASNQERAVAIADTVQHVWVVPDLQKGIQEVQALLEELGVRGDITQETENSCDLTVQLNKMQLVQLVRSLAEGTGELVSNAAPQPEQKLFAGVGETMVTYHIKLLKN